MSINWTLVVEAVKALAWPIVAAFALYLFRRPLVELVAQVARRVRKVALFEVSLELATLPELRPTWSVRDVDTRQLTSSQIFDSYSGTLFEELLKPTPADYAIVDLGSGEKWLTSRLFIFSLILWEVTGLRAFVFLETANGVRRRFLAVATPDNVRRRLGQRYPWLEEACARALAGHYWKIQNPQPEAAGQTKFSNMESPYRMTTVATFVKTFIEALHRVTDPPPDELSSYLVVGAERERAHWIDGERLERDLGGVLDYAA
jgi:hypothetical protein